MKSTSVRITVWLLGAKPADTPTKGSGAIVIAMDAKGALNFMEFVKEAGYCIMHLLPGTYTLLCMMGYTNDGRPVQSYVAQTVVVGTKHLDIGMNLEFPEKKGDIKVTVKIGGIGVLADSPVRLDPGGIVRFTIDDGTVNFPYVFGGPYTVTAYKGSLSAEFKTRTGIMVQDTEKLILPDFVF